MKFRYIILCLVLALSLVMGAGCNLITEETPAEPETPSALEESTPIESEPVITASGEQPPVLPNIADVVAMVKPSVVAINTEIMTRDFFNRPSTQESAGSGWIISDDGYIVTNNHMVEGAQSITIILDDGRIFDAQIVGTDSLTDLAVVKIEAENLPAARVGDSSEMRIGDWVVAIGNSLGQGIRATQGIVSRTGVSLQVDVDTVLYGLIETDAAINPGNSGGPLVNLAGEVIGINSVKTVQVEVEGVGYAISSQEAIPIIEQLIATGVASHPWLGVSLYPVDQYVIENFNLSIDRGVFIVEVVPGSPADQAGLKPEDVITSFAGIETTSVEDLVIGIRSASVGQEVEIVYWRDNEEHTTTATLIKRPD